MVRTVAGSHAIWHCPLCLDLIHRPEHANLHVAHHVMRSEQWHSWRLGSPNCLAAPAVRASHLKWLPNGSSMPSETKSRFGVNQLSILPHGAAPVEPHIQLARLGPGQEIQLEAHCIKGAHA